MTSDPTCVSFSALTQMISPFEMILIHIFIELLIHTVSLPLSLSLLQWLTWPNWPRKLWAARLSSCVVAWAAPTESEFYSTSWLDIPCSSRIPGPGGLGGGDGEGWHPGPGVERGVGTVKGGTQGHTTVWTLTPALAMMRISTMSHVRRKAIRPTGQ